MDQLINSAVKMLTGAEAKLTHELILATNIELTVNKTVLDNRPK